MKTNLGVFTTTDVGPYRAVTWQAGDDGPRSVIGLDGSGHVVPGDLGAPVAVWERRLRDAAMEKAAWPVAEMVAPAVVGYLLALPDHSRPSVDAEDGACMERLLDDVRWALGHALMQTDAYRAARAFESVLNALNADRGHAEFRPDIGLVHLLQRERRDLVQEAVRRGLVGPAAREMCRTLLDRSSALHAAVARHLPESLPTPSAQAGAPERDIAVEAGVSPLDLCEWASANGWTRVHGPVGGHPFHGVCLEKEADGIRFELALSRTTVLLMKEVEGALTAVSETPYGDLSIDGDNSVCGFATVSGEDYVLVAEDEGPRCGR